MTSTCKFINKVIFGCLLATLLAACGNDSKTQTIPTAATIFYSHSLAFRNTTAMSWGYNGFGQLGDGTVTNKAVPGIIVGLSGMSGLSVGADHSVAFANNSTVRAWGYNGFGQLGAATAAGTFSSPTHSAVPVKVGTMSHITAVAAGGHHTLALQGDNGTVWAWGYNANGQLGNRTNVNTNLAATPPVPPKQVVRDLNGALLTDVKMIAAGGLHSLAVVEPAGGNQTILAWGDNTDGQLGRDPKTLANSNLPVEVNLVDKDGVPTTARILAIAAGGAFSLALTDDFKVWAWGYNGFGQLGLDPTKIASSFTPAVVFVDSSVPDKDKVALTDIKAIAAGLDHVIALDNTGSLWAWGFNAFGQLGNNTAFDSFKPVAVINSATGIGAIEEIVRVVGHHNLVRDKKSLQSPQGHLWSWGDNGIGQLGDGTTINRLVPVRVFGF